MTSANGDSRSYPAESSACTILPNPLFSSAPSAAEIRAWAAETDSPSARPAAGAPNSPGVISTYCAAAADGGAGFERGRGIAAARSTQSAERGVGNVRRDIRASCPVASGGRGSDSERERTVRMSCVTGEIGQDGHRVQK